jgi:hypothetical protein
MVLRVDGAACAVEFDRFREPALGQAVTDFDGHLSVLSNLCGRMRSSGMRMAELAAKVKNRHESGAKRH